MDTHNIPSFISDLYSLEWKRVGGGGGKKALSRCKWLLLCCKQTEQEWPRGSCWPMFCKITSPPPKIHQISQKSQVVGFTDFLLDFRNLWFFFFLIFVVVVKLPELFSPLVVVVSYDTWIIFTQFWQYVNIVVRWARTGVETLEGVKGPCLGFKRFRALWRFIKFVPFYFNLNFIFIFCNDLYLI